MGLPWQQNESTLFYVWGGALFFLFFFFTHLALWLVHDMLSSARHYGSQGDGIILTPGPPSSSPDKGFFPEPGKALDLSRTKEPDLSKQVLRQLSCHCSYCWSGLYWLWNAAVRLNSLFYTRSWGGSWGDWAYSSKGERWGTPGQDSFTSSAALLPNSLLFFSFLCF